jgi:hypothetical protein
MVDMTLSGNNGFTPAEAILVRNGTASGMAIRVVRQGCIALASITGPAAIA